MVCVIKHSIFAVLLSGVLFFTVGAAATQSTRLQILTPSLSDRQTGALKLENDLEVYLISDPKATQSAAAMCVHVGSWDNPEEAMGMAHFVEHMLFLGTEEYPEEGAFQQLVTQNGGNYSAFTTNDSTCYLFSIDSKVYPEALNRLASFFKKPLFTESCTHRELEAVQGEFSATLQNDVRRCNAVMHEFVNPEHPDSRFTAGNKQSLHHVSNQELREWHEAHYSANLMRLIVYSPLPLEELQELVKKNFSAICNLENSWNPPQVPLLSTAEGKIAFVQSVVDRRMLTLDWEIDHSLVNLDAKPEDFAARILENQGPQGISARLKEEHLATQMSAGCYRWGGQNYIFRLQIALTDKGLQNIDTVIERCFAGINAANQTEIPQHLYDDARKMAELFYQYQQRNDPFSTIYYYVWTIFDESLETFPEFSQVVQRFDPEGIKQLFAQLTPERVYVTVNTDLRQIGKAADRMEKWLNVPYTVETISQDRMERWRQAKDEAFKLPRANKWIPQDLTLIAQEARSSVSESVIPQLLFDDAGGRVYHSPDEQFEIPEVYCRFSLLSPELVPGQPKDEVLCDLYMLLLNRHLSALTVEAAQAGLNIAVGQDREGLFFEVTGYSEKALSLLTELITSMKNIEPSLGEFNDLKNRLSLQYRDRYKSSPLTQTKDVLYQIILQNYCTIAQQAALLPDITLQDLKGFVSRLYAKTYLKGLIYGNFTTAQAQQAYESVRQTLGGEPWPLEEHHAISVVDLPEDQLPHALESFTSHPHDAVGLLIQSHDATRQTRAAMTVLGMAIESPFFKRVRTEQQTAYALRAWTIEEGNQPFLLMLLESSNYTVDVILSRFESFLAFFADTLESSFSESAFEGAKNALLTEAKRPARNLYEMGDRLFTLAFETDETWQEYNQRVQALKELTYEDFCRIVHETLGPLNQRRLAVVVRGQPGPELQDPYQTSQHPQEYKKELSYRAGR